MRRMGQMRAGMEFVDTGAFHIGSKGLARNAMFNIFGQAAVAVVAIALVPRIVRGLGNDAFGLLSLAFVMFGSIGILELGLGRATTKFVAEYLGSGDLNRLNAVVWTSFGMQVLIGLLGGFLLAAVAPFLVGGLLKVPRALAGDARTTLLLLAVSMPIVLGSSALRGALEGAQRFDLVNSVKVALNISTYVIPMVGVWLKARIPAIVFVLLAARLVAAVAYLLWCVYAIPILRRKFAFSGATARSLFSYAGWVAISNVVVPILVQVDRYFIAALVSIGAVTFYSVPFDILNGLWIIPGAIAAVLFPAFSNLQTRGGKHLADLYARPVKYILIALGPLVFFMVAFSNDILSLWQGPAFAETSAHVLQILVIGVLINSLGWIPMSLLTGLGRPEIVAKIHLLQLPLYLALAYLLISQWGIVGAAVAFTLRVALEAAFLFAASWRLLPETRRVLWSPELLGAGASLFVLVLVLFGIRQLQTSLFFQAGLVAVLFVLFATVLWFRILDRTDKDLLKSLLSLWRRYEN